jgi:hypothetical protein
MSLLPMYYICTIIRAFVCGTENAHLRLYSNDIRQTSYLNMRHKPLWRALLGACIIKKLAYPAPSLIHPLGSSILLVNVRPDGILVMIVLPTFNLKNSSDSAQQCSHTLIKHSDRHIIVVVCCSVRHSHFITSSISSARLI